MRATNMIVTRQIVSLDGKSAKKEVLTSGDDKKVSSYFRDLISRSRDKADRCSVTENPNGYKFSMWTKKRAHVTVGGKLFIFEIKSHAN